MPLPIDGRLTGERVDNTLRLAVDGPAAGDVLELDVYVVTTDEVLDAPRLRVTDSMGREIGSAQPPTEAPPAEPGPGTASISQASTCAPASSRSTGNRPCSW